MAAWPFNEPIGSSDGREAFSTKHMIRMEYLYSKSTVMNSKFRQSPRAFDDLDVASKGGPVADQIGLTEYVLGRWVD